MALAGRYWQTALKLIGVDVGGGYHRTSRCLRLIGRNNQSCDDFCEALLILHWTILIFEKACSKGVATEYEQTFLR